MVTLAARGVQRRRLVQAARWRLDSARAEAAAAHARVESLMRAWSYHGGTGDVEDLRGEWVPACRMSEALEAELAALEETALHLTPSLAAAVARAVTDAGGAAQVAHDLADIRLVAAAATNGEEAELGRVREQLEALGSSDAGRAAQALRHRRSELAAAVEARRAGARDRAKAEALATVEAATAGDLKHWRALADAVAAHPDAFHESLGPALEAAPMSAFEAAGFAGFAGIGL